MIQLIRKYGLLLCFAALACLLAVPAATAEEAPAPIADPAAACGSAMPSCGGAGALPPGLAEAGACLAASTPYRIVVKVPSTDAPGKDGEAVEQNHLHNVCCTNFNCCNALGGGCESCPQGGLRWYQDYECQGGQYICTVLPDSCPTPC